MRQHKAIWAFWGLILPLHVIDVSAASADMLMSVNNAYSITQHHVAVNPGGSFRIDINIDISAASGYSAQLNANTNHVSNFSGSIENIWHTPQTIPGRSKIKAFTVSVDPDTPLGEYALNVTNIQFYGASSGTPGPDLILRVVNGPILSLYKTILNRTALQVGDSLSNDRFGITNPGEGSLNYSISDDAAWLNVSPTGGSSMGEYDVINVLYDISALSAGTYNATITVDSNAANSPQTINVSVNIGIRPLRPDLDGDGDVDQSDFGLLQRCGGDSPLPPQCQYADLDVTPDDDVDADDMAVWLRCSSGAEVPADPGCDD